MINDLGRAAINRGVQPAGRWLVRRGIHPDAMTVFGTAGATGFAVWLIPTGHLFAASMIVWGFAMLDVLDGAMARARGVSSPFGGVLDSLCDRIVDGAVFAGIAWWAAASDRWTVAALALICLVSGQLISYIKARAEAAGLRGDGGIVERAERLILGLAGIGLTGLGLWWAVDVALWLLAVGSLVTVGQRIATVWASAREQYGAATGHTDTERPGRPEHPGHPGHPELTAEAPTPEPRDVER